MLTEWRAIVLGAVALLLVLFLTACSGGSPGATPATTSPPATDSPTPAATGSPTPAATPPLSPTADPPARDRIDLAQRYLGLPADAPRVARTEPFAHEVEDSEAFNLLDLNDATTYEVTATLQAITDHAYFFVQDGTSFSESALQQIAADFEDEVWPAVTAAFCRRPACRTTTSSRTSFST